MLDTSYTISPTTTTALTSVLIMLVDVFKGVFKISGNLNQVRLLALFLALVLSFGDAILGKPSPPDLTWSLCFNVFMQAMLLAGAAFGWNAVRNTANTGAAGTGDPLAQAAQSVEGAQANLDNANQSIAAAQAAPPVQAMVYTPVVPPPPLGVAPPRESAQVPAPVAPSVPPVPPVGGD